ncbi:MAG TPA: transposase [Chloroflexota bacterium]
MNPNHSSHGVLLHVGSKTDHQTVPVRFLVNQFNGYTSRILHQRYTSLVSRLPTLQSRGWYAGSVGHVSAETVRRYIDAQKGK